MTPVYQKIVNTKTGDCLRSSIASLFDLKIEQVPHFRLFSDERERYVLSGFYWAMGYNWVKCGNPGKDLFKYKDSINGIFEASIKSGDKIAHAVLIDLNGVVIHDPSPNRTFKGKNVLKSGDLIWWTITEKITHGK